MKTKLLVFLSICLTQVSSAADLGYEYFRCKPTQPNGLQIKALNLRVSTEDPEAEMIMTFLNRPNKVRTSYSYDSDGNSYDFTPENSKNPYGLKIQKNNGSYQAHVTREGVDTFTTLSCKKVTFEYQVCKAVLPVAPVDKGYELTMESCLKGSFDIVSETDQIITYEWVGITVEDSATVCTVEVPKQSNVKVKSPDCDVQ